MGAWRDGLVVTDRPGRALPLRGLRRRDRRRVVARRLGFGTGIRRPSAGAAPAAASTAARLRIAFGPAGGGHGLRLAIRFRSFDAGEILFAAEDCRFLRSVDHLATDGGARSRAWLIV